MTQISEQENQNMFIGLDIGSSKICAAICEVDPQGGLNLKGIGISLSNGIRKGEIVSEVDLQIAIERALKRAERNAGVRPKRVLTSVPFKGVTFSLNSGFVMSKEEDGISDEEKRDCIRRSKNIVKNENQTLMHVIPIDYRVDGVKVSSLETTMGRNLEVQSHLILGSGSTLKTLTQVLRGLELKIQGLIYDPLAASQVSLTVKEREEGVLFIDIGGQFTKVSIFQNKRLIKSSLIPVGGETFTSDVATCLKVSIPEAERIKTVYGDVRPEDVDVHASIPIRSLDGKRIYVKKRYLCEVLSARATELTQLIKKECPKLVSPPYTIVLGGGGGLLRGIWDRIEEELDLPLRHGVPEQMKSVIENSDFATAIGLVLYGIETRAIQYKELPGSPLSTRVTRWIRDFF